MSGMNKGEFTVQGMILRSTPQGDYDKRLVLLTREKGKITVFARGARRGKSAFGGKTEPFSFGTFVIGPGKSAYYMRQADISNYFAEMRQDYERSCYGFYFLEFAEYYSREEVGELALLQLLYQTLRALANDSIPNKLIRHIFELKTFALQGEYPEVFTCLSCHKPLREGYFSVEKGGMFCEACSQKAEGGIFADGTTLYTMQYIVSAELNKLYTFVLKEDVFVKFQKIMTLYARRYIDKEFKTLSVLEQ